jgi:hypothetical protein
LAPAYPYDAGALFMGQRNIMCLHPGMNLGLYSDEELEDTKKRAERNLRWEEEGKFYRSPDMATHFLSYYKSRIEWLQRELDRREAERNKVVDEAKEALIMAELAKFAPVPV